MCTSLAFLADDFYFGRNMDIEYHFDEKIVITPRNYHFQFKNGIEWNHHYAMIGMAAIRDVYPLYAEAMNEKGLCMAGLNFVGNAYYFEPTKRRESIAPFELIPWILGQCNSVLEAKKILKDTILVNVTFNEQTPLAYLHWHIADKVESIVVECTAQGMMIYENKVGVLSNNPPFDFQLTNLAQYLNLKVENVSNKFSLLGIQPFSKGMGSIGLPGDFSSASRFVRLAFLKEYATKEATTEANIAQFFHLLEHVAVPNGLIDMGKNQCYKTIYSCCMQASKGIYYYKGYDDVQLSAVDLMKEDLNLTKLISYPIGTKTIVRWLN